MPTIRPYKIIDDEYVDQTSYTIDLELPTSGILSTLMLTVKARTETTGVCPSPWLKYLISSVSVNQAGQAFLNAAPPEAFQTDMYYKTGKMARRGMTHGVVSPRSEITEQVPILFGEHINDLEHTVDLSRMNDPKLSITYDLEATGPTGETVWDTDYKPRFTVVAHLIQGTGIPASKGYHSLRQIESYNPTNSQVKKLELKGARPIKRLYCAHDMDNPYYGFIHSLDQARLYGDNEAWVPFLMKCDDWQDLIRDIYGLCEVKADVYYIMGGYVVDSCVDRRVYMKGALPDDKEHRLIMYGGSGRTTMTEIIKHDGTAPAPVLHGRYNFAGICPWSTQVIDFKKMLGMEHLDPREHAPVYLELTHTSSATDRGNPVNIYIEDLATTY